MKINLFSSVDRSLKIFRDNKYVNKYRVVITGTYFWMFFDWNVNLLGVDDGRPDTIGKN